MFFFFSSRRRHTRFDCDWSSDVCSSDLTMRLHRGQEPSDDVWMQGLGTPLWVQFRQFTDDDAEIEAMVATYRAYNLAHHDELVRPYDGVVAAVRALRDRGKTLGLVTSKMRSGAVRGLRVAGLEDAFSVIVGADEVTHPKDRKSGVEGKSVDLGGRRIIKKKKRKC